MRRIWLTFYWHVLCSFDCPIFASALHICRQVLCFLILRSSLWAFLRTCTLCCHHIVSSFNSSPYWCISIPLSFIGGRSSLWPFSPCVDSQVSSSICPSFYLMTNLSKHSPKHLVPSPTQTIWQCLADCSCSEMHGVSTWATCLLPPAVTTDMICCGQLMTVTLHMFEVLLEFQLVPTPHTIWFQRLIWCAWFLQEHFYRTYYITLRTNVGISRFPLDVRPPFNLGILVFSQYLKKLPCDLLHILTQCAYW